MKAIRVNKDQIQFSHTFRYIQRQTWRSLFYLFLFVLPLLVLFLLHYRDLSLWMNSFARYFLSASIQDVRLVEDAIPFIPMLGALSSLDLPSPVTGRLFALVLSIISFILVIVFVTGRRKGHPISIFLSFASVILLISGIFGLIYPDRFPYTVRDFSELYMSQTFATVLFFIILTGAITVLLGVGSVFHRVAFVIVALVYLMVFSTVRYVVYLLLVSKVSLLFMPALIFAFGPFFDSLFLVYFYGMYVHRLIKRMQQRRSEVVWKW